MVDARAYDSPDSYGTHPDPPQNQNVTELSQSDPDFETPNVTQTVTAAPTSFMSMLGNLSENVKKGNLENDLSVKVGRVMELSVSSLMEQAEMKDGGCFPRNTVVLLQPEEGDQPCVMLNGPLSHTLAWARTRRLRASM